MSLGIDNSDPGNFILAGDLCVIKGDLAITFNVEVMGLNTRMKSRSMYLIHNFKLISDEGYLNKEWLNAKTKKASSS